eukprot:970184-Rhodomonas_salina.2
MGKVVMMMTMMGIGRVLRMMMTAKWYQRREVCMRWWKSSKERGDDVGLIVTDDGDDQCDDNDNMTTTMTMTMTLTMTTWR